MKMTAILGDLTPVKTAVPFSQLNEPKWALDYLPQLACKCVSTEQKHCPVIPSGHLTNSSKKTPGNGNAV